MKNSVTNNNITIHIDCSINSAKSAFKDSIFKFVLSDELNKDPRMIEAKEVEKLFLRIIFTKLIFFISWFEMEKARLSGNLKEIDFSDFLRISMINNNEQDSYLEAPQQEIHEFLKKRNNCSEHLLMICQKKLEKIMHDTKKKVLFAFDEAFDCRYISKDNHEYWCFPSRLDEKNSSMNNHNIYHCLDSTILKLKQEYFVLPRVAVTLAGTSLSAAGVLSGELSSFKEDEIRVSFIKPLVDGKKFGEKFLKMYFKVDRHTHFILFETLDSIPLSRPRLLLDYIFDLCFLKENGKIIFDIAIEKVDLLRLRSELKYGFMKISRFEKIINTTKDSKCHGKELLAILFHNVLFMYGKLTMHSSILDYEKLTDTAIDVVDIGVVSFQEMKTNNPGYLLEPVAFSYLHNYFSLSNFENFKISFNMFFSEYKEQKNKKTQHGYTFEEMESLMIIAHLDHSRQTPELAVKSLFIDPFVEYFPENTKLSGFESASLVSKTKNLDSKSVADDNIMICPCDTNNSGPDKSFGIKLHFSDQSTQRILVLIQDRDQKTASHNVAGIQTVWTSPILCFSEDGIGELQETGKKCTISELLQKKPNYGEITSKEDQNLIGTANWVEKREGLKAEIQQFDYVLSILVCGTKPSTNSTNNTCLIPGLHFQLLILSQGDA